MWSNGEDVHRDTRRCPPLTPPWHQEMSSSPACRDCFVGAWPVQHVATARAKIVSPCLDMRLVSSDWCPATGVQRLVSSKWCPANGVQWLVSSDWCPATSVQQLVSSDWCCAMKWLLSLSLSEHSPPPGSDMWTPRCCSAAAVWGCRLHAQQFKLLFLWWHHHSTASWSGSGHYQACEVNMCVISVFVPSQCLYLHCLPQPYSFMCV